MMKEYEGKAWNKILLLKEEEKLVHLRGEEKIHHLIR